MDHRTALTWSSLNILTKKRYEALLKVYASLDEALEHLNEEMLRSLQCRDETVYKVLLCLEEFDLKRYEEELHRLGVSLCTMDDPSYPRLLREIPDPPVFLYTKGDISICSQPCIALVGTRRMSLYGKRTAQEFTSAFVRAGVVTVSGLAQGIDAEVARETIRSGGRTIAVLGHGLGMIYPAGHKELAAQIVESGGLLLSEYALDTEPTQHTFPERNRIIAGLSLGTVVLEAPEDSGAMITARLALEDNREVFAVPGQIFDENARGCHALITRGQAHIATDPADVLREVGIVASEGGWRTGYVPADSHEGKVWEVLTSMPQKLDDIVERTALDPATIGAKLTVLELAGVAKNVGGGMWVRQN
ncbi:DNA-protecting protein DprA [Candidatus Peregrinibacteria bacterium]|nr:DNA-protecting protein DprA [Candidatus Peregrinibacteria bacterium]